MGYDTTFTGSVSVEPPLNEDEIAYLNRFAKTRRMDREKGPYFVDGTGFAGEGGDVDVRDRNSPPSGQPGLWCQWVPAEDGTRIEWDEGEKFYHAVEWMRYLIDHFLKAGAVASETDMWCFAQFGFNHVVNGVIEAQGDEDHDTWTLVVKDNVVTVDHPMAQAGDDRALTAVEMYAIDMIVDGAESRVEDDMNEDGDLSEVDHAKALELGLKVVRAIRANAGTVLCWVESED